MGHAMAADATRATPLHDTARAHATRCWNGDAETRGAVVQRTVHTSAHTCAASTTTSTPHMDMRGTASEAHADGAAQHVTYAHGQRAPRAHTLCDGEQWAQHTSTSKAQEHQHNGMIDATAARTREEQDDARARDGAARAVARPRGHTSTPSNSAAAATQCMEATHTLEATQRGDDDDDNNEKSSPTGDDDNEYGDDDDYLDATDDEEDDADGCSREGDVDGKIDEEDPEDEVEPWRDK